MQIKTVLLAAEEDKGINKAICSLSSTQRAFFTLVCALARNILSSMW